VGGAPVRLVVGDQHLATPHGAVGAVAGAVERHPDDLLVRTDAVFGEHRRDVGVVVLDPADRPSRRVRSRPLAGPVVRMQVGHQQLGPYAGEFFEVPLGAGERVNGADVVHVADVLAGPGVPAGAQRAGVLEVRADGQDRRHVERQRQRQRRVPARAADRQLGAADMPAHRVVARHPDAAVVP
jgi:hypothetical protein